MAGVNRVILVGNLGRDPELRYTQSGQPVATLSLATSERWKGRDGQAGERTEWHRVVAWGATGEAAAKHLQKGSKAYVEGRLQTREWEDREGQKRRTVEVIASSIVFLDGRAFPAERNATGATGGGRAEGAPGPRGPTPEDPGAPDPNAEIPF